jgi:hypothetical protein
MYDFHLFFLIALPAVVYFVTLFVLRAYSPEELDFLKRVWLQISYNG